MRVFFIDDSGPRSGPGKPYFCMGGFSVDSKDLGRLKTGMTALRKKWDLRDLPEDEVKFSSIGKAAKGSKPSPLSRLGYSWPQRLNFAQDMIAKLVKVPSVKVFSVGVLRTKAGSEGPVATAFAVLAERFEFSLNNVSERVGLIICDQEDRADKIIREALYVGTAWTNMPRIAETVLFVPSCHSPGVQFADFVVGSAARWWNYEDDQYLRTLEPAFHTNPQGKWKGCGLKSFPHANYPTLG